MPGVKGRSGGPRPNTGPQPKKRTLAIGQEFVGLETGARPQVWTVTEIARDKITLTKADGETVRLLNG